MIRSPEEIDEFVRMLQDFRRSCRVTTLAEVEEERRSPFHLLVACIISLRTKDEVTREASGRLFQLAGSPAELARLPEEEIASAIYPAGFYRNKARQLKAIGAILEEKHDGNVPEDREALLALPGVGRKTANLVLGLAFGIPAICVDTHVHRIPNRMGIISTKKPEETEKALEHLLPQEYWIDINDLLVTFGQNCCLPLSPLCSGCEFSDVCRRIGVDRHR